jgi:hypothetical protein
MMLKGVHLSLMIGPAVPLPVPREVIDAVTSIRVTTADEGASAFQIQFSLSSKSPLHTLFLLSGGASIPLVRVVIAVTVNGSPHVLADGVMTNHEISPGSDVNHPTLTITGEDLTRVMDYFDFSGLPFPAMPAEARVLLILAKYAIFGVVPKVIPSVLIDIPIPVQSIPRQQGTDLAYVRQLAADVGYVFYHEAGPVPGISAAYWGPRIKIGAPQRALSSANMDSFANATISSASFKSDSKKMPVLFIQEPNTKMPIPIPIPDITPLSPPLGIIPPFPTGIEPIDGTGKLGPIRAALIGLAKASKAEDAVQVDGSLDVSRYGGVLEARKLVGVRGVGLAFDGLYYVNSVTHDIKRGEYKQTFRLSRNGLLSTVPKVTA